MAAQTAAQVLAEKLQASKKPDLTQENNSKIITLLSDNKKSSCQIHLHGATVTSWKPNGNERIFLSEKVICDQAGKGIRGGIPIVFPNFGPWELGPQHGFARSKTWEVVKKSDRSASFQLTEDEESLKIWENKFKLTFTVKVTDIKLLTTLEVKNMNDNNSFDFTTLLHTYFKVPDISKTKISGFEGCKYFDALQDRKQLVQAGDIAISENVDSVYVETDDCHYINFPSQKTNNPNSNSNPNSSTPTTFKISIRKTNLPDTVVWNPWIEKSKKMGDFGDDEYKNMVCVEAGYVGDRKILKAGEVFICEQVLEDGEVGDENFEEKYEEVSSNGCEFFGNFSK